MESFFGTTLYLTLSYALKLCWLLNWCQIFFEVKNIFGLYMESKKKSARKCMVKILGVSHQKTQRQISVVTFMCGSFNQLQAGCFCDYRNKSSTYIAFIYNLIFFHDFTPLVPFLPYFPYNTLCNGIIMYNIWKNRPSLNTEIINQHYFQSTAHQGCVGPGYYFTGFMFVLFKTFYYRNYMKVENI